MNVEVIREELASYRLWIAVFYSAFLAGFYTWLQNTQNVVAAAFTVIVGLIAFLFAYVHKTKMDELREIAK